MLQLDAHADLRVAYQGFVGSHASVMHRVLTLADVSRLVAVGLRDLCVEEHQAIEASSGRAVAFFDAHLARRKAAGEPFVDVAKEIAEALPRRRLHLVRHRRSRSRAVSAHRDPPCSAGCPFHEAMTLFDAVVDSGRRIVGFDVCEVAPGPGGDEWDANVGARILYKLIGYVLRSRPS